MLTITYIGINSLDLSNNTALQFLELIGTNIVSLNLNKNLKLISLICVDNTKLNQLVFDNCTKLQRLVLNELNLNEIDLSKYPDIRMLDLSQNPLKTIDISHNKLLEVLYLNNCQLSNIDLTNSSSYFVIELRKNNLYNVDVSHCHKLNKLSLSENHLTSLTLESALPYEDLGNQYREIQLTLPQNSDGITYNIPLSSIDTGIEASKIIDLQGTSIENDKFMNIKNGDLVTYTYITHDESLYRKAPYHRASPEIMQAPLKVKLLFKLSPTPTATPTPEPTATTISTPKPTPSTAPTTATPNITPVKTNYPQTGDNSNATLWIMLITLAIGIMFSKLRLIKNK